MHKDNNMPRRQRRAYEMHSKTKEYKNRIKYAEENIKIILEDNELQPIIEFSGGKDSIVLTSMVIQQDNTIPVWNYHPGYAQSSKQLFRSEKTNNEILKTLNSMKPRPLDVYIDNEPTMNPNYRIGDYFNLLFEYMEKKECNLELLGIRGQESCTRKQRVKQQLVHREQDRIVSFPIKDLTVDDVWAYIVVNDIYYTSHYDKYGPVYGWDNVRFTCHFNENDVYTGGNYFFDKILYNDEVHEQPKQSGGEK